MTAPLDLRFVLSAPTVRDLPDTQAEAAVVGRSNVGKSSLINALAGRRSLAQVSKTPGRTRLLNFYRLGQRPTSLVDLPGYGYSAVSKQTKAAWPDMIEQYLLGREALAMVLALVDGEIGPTKLDASMLEWLVANDCPYTVVATKHDKVKPSQRVRRGRELAAACGLEPEQVVWVSAHKQTGIDRLRGLVLFWLDETVPGEGTVG